MFLEQWSLFTMDENIFDIEKYSDEEVNCILNTIDNLCKDDSDDEKVFASVPCVGENQTKYTFPTISKERGYEKGTDYYTSSIRELKAKSLEKRTLERRIEGLESLLGTTQEQLHELIFNIDYRLKKIEKMFNK